MCKYQSQSEKTAIVYSIVKSVIDSPHVSYDNININRPNRNWFLLFTDEKVILMEFFFEFIFPKNIYIYNKVFLRAEVKAADVAADILYGSKCLNAIGSSQTSGPVCGICSNNRWKATLHARFDVSVFPALDSLWFRNCSSSSLSPRPPGACTSSSWPPMCPGDKSLTRVLQLPAEPS